MCFQLLRVLCVFCVVFWGCICLAVNSVCDKRAETLYLTGKTLTLCSGQLSPCFRWDRHKKPLKNRFVSAHKCNSIIQFGHSHISKIFKCLYLLHKQRKVKNHRNSLNVFAFCFIINEILIVCHFVCHCFHHFQSPFICRSSPRRTGTRCSIMGWPPQHLWQPSTL